MFSLLQVGRVNMLLNAHMDFFIAKKNSKFIINNQKT